MDRLFPGRWEALRPVTAQELKATSILAMDLTEASVKIRTGAPGDDPEDTTWPIWAGVLPIHQVAGTPIPDIHVTDPHTPPVTPLV